MKRCLTNLYQLLFTVGESILCLTLFSAAFLIGCTQSRHLSPPPTVVEQISAPRPSATPTPTVPVSPTPDPVSITIIRRPDSPTPTPLGPQPQEPYLGIWISSEELARLPVSGPAWEHLKAVADQHPGRPDLSKLNSVNNVNVLAKALVYARTGEVKYRDEVIDNLVRVMGTEETGSTLTVGRSLVAYVIAADLVNLPATDPEVDQQFQTWLQEVITKELDGLTLQSTHENRPNNWGTHAGASRAAVAIYLGDTAELARTAQVFKGWLGDRNAYAGFIYGRLYWQADPDNPVAINPVGATKESHSIDGALPEEMRRGGRFRWPPGETNYPWGALQGALVQAEILHRAGYPTWEWADKALLRAVQFLYDIGWEPVGDDEWQPWLVNYAYGTNFQTSTLVPPGKNMGWTHWTHSQDRLNDNVANEPE
jgi:hypothetical protein